MKFLKYLFIGVTSIIFIASCQKELDFQTDGLAHGTLKSDITGDCLPALINGIFKADSLLDNTNFIDVQVNLTSTGTYDIKSDTLNGYSFRGTGTLGISGINTVRLYATGKPLVSQVDMFTIRFDSTVCKVNITVIGSGTGVAVFTLGGSPGTCSGATINGTYTQGTALDVNNTVTITVNVTALGTYTLLAASVNGMLFTSAGVFTTFGVQSVTLNGAGMPLVPGIFNAIVTNLSGTCTFSVSVLPSGGGGPAVYTLNVAAGACSGANYTGVYTVGVPLASSNVVLVNATVINPGTYTIGTNTVNGVSFSGSGTFTAAGGPQQITLTGSGTPASTGIFNFTATAGISTCTFSVTFDAANEDYVPETPFSNWSNKLVGGTAADTSYIQVSPNTKIINAVTYKIFEEKTLAVPVDSFYHRKNGGKYYKLFDDSYGFGSPFSIDGLLLDSSQAINLTWDIVLGNNTYNGLPASGLILAKITEKGAAAVIAGNTYNNVIKVIYTYQYNIGSGNVDYSVEEVWYAKGKGVIYDKINDLPVTATEVYETTRVQIF